MRAIEVVDHNGNHLFDHETGDTCEVTGVTINGKRFKIVTENVRHALGINLYRGTLWHRKAGSEHRTLVYRCWN